MSKLDITKEELYIKDPRRVVRSVLNFHGKPNFVSSRSGDGFIYVLSGGCKYDFDDGTVITVNAGDILYLADRAKYRMLLTSETYEVIYCDFIFDSTDLRQSARFAIDPAMGADAIFKKAYRVYTSAEVQKRAKLLSLLYDTYAILISSDNRAYIGRNAIRRIEIAKDYIDDHYADAELSVGALAKMADMSEVYFRRLFKSVCHVSPSEYITAIRLENAKHMMEYTPISLNECAEKCGFSSVQYFSRVFKASLDISPAKYRKTVIYREKYII